MGKCGQPIGKWRQVRRISEGPVRVLLLQRPTKIEYNQTYGASSCRSIARDAVAHLGSRAQLRVPTGLLAHFAEWFGWPDWLLDGTELALNGAKSFPATLTLADDLTILANIIDNGFASAFLARLQLSSLGVPGSTNSLVRETAPDLRCALTVLARAITVSNPIYEAKLELDGEMAKFVMSSQIDMGRIFGLAAAVVVMMLRQTFAVFVGGRTAELKITIGPEAIHDLESLNTDLLIKVSIGRDLCISFPEVWLQTLNPIFDRDLWLIAVARIEARERAFRLDSEIATIESQIAAIFERGGSPPRMKQVAEQMGISSRSLARKLAAADVTFHDLVEARRRHLAAVLIARADIPLKEVAHGLGFSDMSTFSRTFKKWFSKSPAAYRSESRR